MNTPIVSRNIPLRPQHIPPKQFLPRSSLSQQTIDPTTPPSNTILYSNQGEYTIPRRIEAPDKGVSYHLLRWPLLFFIGLAIMFELFFYILVRWTVLCYEFGGRIIARKQKSTRKELKEAADFDSWRKAALKLDKIQQKEKWKREDFSPFYDGDVLKTLVSQMEDARRSDDIPRLMDALRIACKHNVGGIENEALYSRTFFGSKNLLQEYLQEVIASLAYLCQDETRLDEKRELLKETMSSYGKTALCLSGGATMAFYHFGVVKCLLEQQLLPTVISGTSGGALIAALVCTRTDSELMDILNPDIYLKVNPIDESLFTMMKRFLTAGTFFDVERWKEKLQWITMDLTFLEAYKRTGRILNITITPESAASPPSLLNYRNSPHVMIGSAILASASIPGLLIPGELQAKNGDGSLSPYYQTGKKWRDGSFKTDIPIRPLNQLFNVNYTVVSQVNPHIVLFFYENRGSGGNPTSHRSGYGWRGGFLFSTLEYYLKLDMLKWLRLLRALDLLPRFLGADGSFLFLQRFNGTVTILPRAALRDYIHLFGFVARDHMEEYINRGERNTWPKISMISNRMTIEYKLQQTRALIQQRINQVNDAKTTPNNAGVEINQ